MLVNSEEKQPGIELCFHRARKFSVSVVCICIFASIFIQLLRALDALFADGGFYRRW